MGFERDTECEPFGPGDEEELRRSAVADAVTDLSDLDLVTTEIDRFYALTIAARAAALLGKHEIAKQLSLELLALSPLYKSNWNYGNAIHHAHTSLGLVALAEGDTSEAVKHLLAAGATPGSPHLNTFGPSMELARALMRQGQFQPVAEYLKLCRAFWELGQSWLDVWEEMVGRKVVPNCVMHAFQ